MLSMRSVMAPALADLQKLEAGTEADKAAASAASQELTAHYTSGLTALASSALAVRS